MKAIASFISEATYQTNTRGKSESTPPHSHLTQKFLWSWYMMIINKIKTNGWD